jgi:hypothetical protein
MIDEAETKRKAIINYQKGIRWKKKNTEKMILIFPSKMI